MEGTYYSNGKLILSGEYMVLYGAGALVLPLKVGQEMRVTSIKKNTKSNLYWQASEYGREWFSAIFTLPDLVIQEASDRNIAHRLTKILNEAVRLNPHLLGPGESFEVQTNINFNMKWGLGSSSTLVANIARWANIDPYELHFLVSGGSGADIAGAISPGPVIYKLLDQKPSPRSVAFHPQFFRNIWLIYSGQKQDSGLSLRDFMLQGRPNNDFINRIDQITHKMVAAQNPEFFMSLIHVHELILAQVLNKKPIAETMFADFKGQVKSLGAWGGDFIMAVSETDDSYIRSYFANKGMPVVFRFDEIVLQ